MIGIRMKMPKNCQKCSMGANSIDWDVGEEVSEVCECMIKGKITKYPLRSNRRKRPDYCPLVELKGETE